MKRLTIKDELSIQGYFNEVDLNLAELIDWVNEHVVGEGLELKDITLRVYAGGNYDDTDISLTLIHTREETDAEMESRAKREKDNKVREIEMKRKQLARLQAELEQS